MSRRRTIAAALLAVTLVAACGGDDGGSDGTGTQSGGDTRTVSGGEPIGPADEGIEGVEAFEVASNAHTTENLVYNHRPPVGGEHNPTPATCGFYDANPPADQYLVHSIEHGAVWIAYDPSLDEAGKDALRQLVETQPKVVATPYDGLDSPLVVTAWARQLALDSVDDPRLEQFVAEYQSGGQSPEPGAPCVGIGEPAVQSPG
jgi:hypothetical protein